PPNAAYRSSGEAQWVRYLLEGARRTLKSSWSSTLVMRLGSVLGPLIRVWIFESLSKVGRGTLTESRFSPSRGSRMPICGTQLCLVEALLATHAIRWDPLRGGDGVLDSGTPPGSRQLEPPNRSPSLLLPTAADRGQAPGLARSSCQLSAAAPRPRPRPVR